MTESGQNLESDLPPATGESDSLENRPESDGIAVKEFKGKVPARPGDRKVAIPFVTIKSIMLEASLVLLALALAYLFHLYDQNQILTEYETWDWSRIALVGAIGFLPLLSLFFFVDVLRIPVFEDVRQVADKIIAPLFRDIPIWKLAVISIAAGLGEEFLFRWSIQGGIEAMFASPIYGVVVGIFFASVLFGLCHWLTPSYAVLAMLAGVYFGILMEISGSFVAPAIAHAAYDFAALLYITRWRNRTSNSTE